MAANDTPVAKTESTLLERIQTNPKLPSLGLVIARIVSLIGSHEENVQDLGNLILSDIYLTQRILTMANSVMYRIHGASTITTISRSIVVIGLEQIKLLALGVILVDQLDDKDQIQAMKQEFVKALRASALAQEFATALLPRYKEEAGIAALLSSAARLLIIYLEFAAHQAIEERILAGESESAAFKQVLGSGLNVFTQALIEQWRLPTLLKSAIMGQVSISEAATPEGQLVQLVKASNWVADCYRLPPGAERDTALAEVYLKFKKLLNITRGEFDAVIAAGAAKMGAIHQIVGIESFLPAEESADTGAAAENEAPVYDPLEAAIVLQPVVIEQKELLPTGQPSNARELVLSGLQDVSEAIAVGESLAIALRSAVECIHRGFGFARSVLLLKDTQSQVFRARIWCGDVDKEQLHLLQFDCTNTKDLFAMACIRGVDVQITDMDAPAMREKLPVWLRLACPSARSFIILPVVNMGRPVGCLYLERACVDSKVNAEELTLLQTVKNYMVLAMRTIKV